MRTGGELLVACLEAQGVTTSFGVPGESYLAVLDGLHDSPIDYVVCRQEGGAAYAASAWGKLTGEPGIVFVTRGPGATNASVGLHTAMQDSSPVVCFIGQASTDHLGREAFQEIDYRAFFGPVVKWATQIEHVDRMSEIVARAFSIAQSGRPGPVVVALPEDVLASKTDIAPSPRVRVPVAAPRADDTTEALRLMATAERPLFLVGGGGWTDTGRAALVAFAERNTVAVAPVFRFHDLIDNESACFVGEAGVGMLPHVRRLIAEADVVVAVGIRFGEMTTGAYTLFEMPEPRQTIIHVHPSDAELGKFLQAQLPIQASPNAFCEAIADAVLEPSEGREAWVAAARAAQHEAVIAPPQPGDLDMAAVMQWLQANLPTDVIITSGAGNFSIWNNKHFSYGPGTRLLAPQSGSMGYGLPAAIAAKLAHPDRMVVCFAGDGDLQMNVQELGTATQAGAAPIVLVLNNGMYGTIRLHQERDFPRRVSGTELVNPDFVQLGHAYGFHAERVERTADFAAAFERATESPNGALLELTVPPTMLSPHLSVEQLRGEA